MSPLKTRVEGDETPSSVSSASHPDSTELITVLIGDLTATDESSEQPTTASMSNDEEVVEAIADTKPSPPGSSTIDVGNPRLATEKSVKCKKTTCLKSSASTSSRAKCKRHTAKNFTHRNLILDTSDASTQTTDTDPASKPVEIVVSDCASQSNEASTTAEECSDKTSASDKPSSVTRGPQHQSNSRSDNGSTISESDAGCEKHDLIPNTTEPSEALSESKSGSGVAGGWKDSEDAVLLGMKNEGSTWADIAQRVSHGKRECSKRYKFLTTFDQNDASKS
jgi:hypothetical protein